jgi:EAL domain-containing protein (putative c-di-GMP-specific phosphodiesterase class I)
MSVGILIVDDHTMLVDSLVRLLDREPDMTVLGTAGTCAEGLHLGRELRPQVVIMDYHLPDGTGVETARELKLQLPDTRVVLLTGSGGDRALLDAVGAECEGYLEKTRAFEELAETVRRVHAGAVVLPRERLDELLRLEELVLHYQPVVDLRSLRPVGVEALVRWNRPGHGIVPPDHFIPDAEASGFITQLGRWVTKEACHQAARWRADLPGATELTMAVNVCPAELDEPDFPDHVTAALHDARLHARALTLEITETGVVEDTGQRAECLRQLRELGIRFAVDDFGTGYASLRQLTNKPIDQLKIDRSFVAGMTHDRRDKAVTVASTQLGQSLGLETLAEGIETEDQLRQLQALGCDLGQGYFFSRPLPADGVTAWWEQRLLRSAEQTPAG